MSSAPSGFVADIAVRHRAKDLFRLCKQQAPYHTEGVGHDSNAAAANSGSELEPATTCTRRLTSWRRRQECMRRGIGATQIEAGEARAHQPLETWHWHHSC